MLENTEKAIPTVDASECALLERETAGLSHGYFFFHLSPPLEITLFEAAQVGDRKL